MSVDASVTGEDAMMCACRLLAVGLAVAWLFAESAFGQEWPRFRGPNGSGVSLATTVPVRWTDEDYNWKVTLPGVGHSSPVLWGEKLFVTSGDDETGKRIVLCIDANTGRQLWSREFPSTRHGKHKLNSFASATPAVDSRHVYTCWGTPEEFVVLALDHSGREVWRADLGSFKGGHGFGVSPIVHDDLLVVPNEHEGDSSLFALDCATGKIRWQVPRESKSTWSTPCVFERPGLPPELIFVNWTYGITAIDPQSGQVNWQADVFDKGHTESSISSPIVAGDLVLGTSGWLAVRQEVIAVRPGANSQKTQAERVYCIDRGAPLCTTPLVKDDLLFLWADEGIVTCADLATGNVHWTKRIGGTFYASPICVGDNVYNISADGDVVVLAAAKEYNLVARNPLGQSSHSTPAVAHGRIYLRTFTQLFSIGGRDR